MIIKKQLFNSSEEYYKHHKCCPECGYDKHSSTYLGYVFVKEKPYKDENHCKCKCGWSGITDDLVEK